METGVLEATLLGQFAVRVGGKSVEISSRPAQSLLAYLLLTVGYRHRREKLAALLWPDADDENARQNLRNALWRLNKALGAGYLAADKLVVTFNAAAPYRLDTSILESAVEESVDALVEALSVYRGELLPGFYEEWVLLERERLQAVFERKIESLLDSLTSEARWREVLEWSERWIALGQVPEPAYRALMRAYGALGDTAGVAAAYQRCVKDLAEQLAVEPSPNTTELFRNYLMGERTAPSRAPTASLDRTAAPTPAVPGFLSDIAVEPEQPPFIGREAELARLERARQSTLYGRPGVVFVIGEAGQGKTTMLSEFSHRTLSSHPSAAVAYGSCSAFGGAGDPLSPFREILAMFTGDVDAQWRGGKVSREQAVRSWNLIPDAIEVLIGRSPDLLDTLLSSSELLQRAASYARASRLESLEMSLAEAVTAARARGPDRSRLFESYAAFLETLATRHPLVLIVDDLHWADHSSLSLLFHLGRHLVSRPVLIVGAYRPEEATRGQNGAGSRLAEAVAELERLHGDIRIDLDGTPEEVEAKREFIDAVIDLEPNELDEAFREELLKRTGGNPLFASELMIHLRAQGGLLRDGVGRWYASSNLDWKKLPARVEGVIRNRVASMDSGLEEMLSVASVEGEEFSAEVLARVIRIDQRHVVDRLSREAASRHRLVMDVGMQQLGRLRLSRFRFRHQLFQQHLYDNLGRSHRAQLHEAVGRVIEELHGETAVRVAGQLARHYQLAGLLEPAVRYLLPAGQRALELSAHDEAIRLLDEALDCLEKLPKGSESRELELPLLLALGSAKQARLGYAAEEVGRIFARAREISGHSGKLLEKCQASWNLWAYHMQHAELQQAREIAQELLALSRRALDDSLLLQAHHALWYTTLCQGEFAASRDHCEEGIRLYDSARHVEHAFRFGGHDPGVCARLFSARALWHLGDTERALERADAALELAAERDHPATMTHALVFAAEVRLLRGEGAEAANLAQRALDLADEYDLDHWVAWAKIIKGCALALTGDQETGIQKIEAGIEAYRSIGGKIELPVFLGRLAEALVEDGKLDRSLEILEEAADLAERTGEHRFDAELMRLKGEVCSRLGNESDAGRWFRSALLTARNQGAASFEARLLARLAHKFEEAGAEVRSSTTKTSAGSTRQT